MKRLELIFVFLLCCVLSHAEDLPVVRIEAANLSETFSDGTIQIGEGEAMAAEIRYRGASSLRYQKKSFAIKLKGDDGEKLDTSLLGMRSDNSWIMDAMTIDKARMRNRVSTDLWLDFSNKLYYHDEHPKAVNGTRGKFVEVLLNGEYHGLFCLTEKVDRKQLKIKKYDENQVKGMLYKLVKFNSMWIDDESRYAWDNSKAIWDEGWEASYPDVTEGEPIDWSPLVSTIRWLNEATDEEFDQLIAEKIDLPVWGDYFLFVDLMLGDDNAAKNMYVSFRDIQAPPCLMTVTPWDMDATWGRNYIGEPLSPTTETGLYNQIYARIIYSTNKIAEMFEPRYAELRQSYFSAEALKGYFERYFKLFRSTGVTLRETDRWSGTDGFSLNFDEEEQYIYDWIDNRLAYLDKRYHYTAPSAIDAATNQTPPQHNHDIYTISGVYVGNGNINDFTLPPGMYIVGKKKIVYP